MTAVKKVARPRQHHFESDATMEDFEHMVEAIVEPLLSALELKIEQAKLDITRWIIATSIAVTAIVVTALGVAVNIILKLIK